MYFEISRKDLEKTIRFFNEEGIKFESYETGLAIVVKEEVEDFSLDVIMKRSKDDMDEYYSKPESEAPNLTPEQLLIMAGELDRQTEKPFEELKNSIPELMENGHILSSLKESIQTKWNEITK